MEHNTIFRVLEWCTVFLFLILAISSFITAGKKDEAQKNIILKSRINRFVLGVTMSALNPVQIPFWFIWSTYLMSTRMLRSTESDFNIYTIGIGVGTLSGLAIFIFAGKWIVNKLKASHQVINLVVGIIFFISAIIQLYRVLYKPMGERMKESAGIYQQKSQDKVAGFFVD
jgi:threonine/homoserine/homoserine lactone efflux protein